MPAHAIVRLGKLEAGPAQGGRVTLSPGDDFDAKTSLTAAAQAVAEVLARPEAVNVSLSVTQPARQRGDSAAWPWLPKRNTAPAAPLTPWWQPGATHGATHPEFSPKERGLAIFFELRRTPSGASRQAPSFGTTSF